VSAIVEPTPCNEFGDLGKDPVDLAAEETEPA
jgi:hypothetical protein